MKRSCLWITALLLGSVSLLAETLTIPDTPAGRTLQAWLEAFNSGERSRIETWLTKYEPDKPLDPTMSFREQTGGFDLLGIDRSEPSQLDFRLKEKARPITVIGRLQVKDGNPAQVTNFSLRAVPPGVNPADMNVKLDDSLRRRVIDEAIGKLNESYVYPETAKKMEEDLRARQQRGEYDNITDGEALAALLTKQLQGVSHDRHLRLNVVPPMPAGGTAQMPGPPSEERMRADMERNNCFFEKAERLQPNIGYLKFNAFADPGVCGNTVTAAMNFLGNVDAMIFDLRDNGGGDPKMVAFISSYLFDRSTHLNDLYNRREDSTTQYWTLPWVPGKRLGAKPVFVLTSKRTFSGAEEFSYNLKNLKRATIVGETTGGGAHPVSGHRIADRFIIGVPFARAINPVSKTNWEGTGVEPDVKVPAGEALTVAKQLATEELWKKASGDKKQPE